MFLYVLDVGQISAFEENRCFLSPPSAKCVQSCVGGVGGVGPMVVVEVSLWNVAVCVVLGVWTLK